MTTKKEELFKSLRWNTYQDDEALKTKVKPTEEDKKKVEDFRNFIDEKIKNERESKNREQVCDSKYLKSVQYSWINNLSLLYNSISIIIDSWEELL